MATEYERLMFEARLSEEFIARYTVANNPPTKHRPLNFAAQMDTDQFEVVRCYRHALEIYCKFNKKDDALRLLTHILWLVDTCDIGSMSFALQLLLSFKDNLTPLEKFNPNSRNIIKEKLSIAIRTKLGEFDTDFWLIRSAIELRRDLAFPDNGDVQNIDEYLCKVLALAGHTSFIVGNLGHAASCYEEAGKLAQQVGNAEGAGQLFQQASQINRMLFQQAPTNSIEVDLNEILRRELTEQLQERFLPTPEEIYNEYTLSKDKLVALLSDERLLINPVTIRTRAENYHNRGLRGAIPARDVDEHGNLRTDFREPNDDISRLFEIEFVREAIAIIDFLFLKWQTEGHLYQGNIVSLLKTSQLKDYNWKIVEQAITNHFSGDFVGSIHLLIPQFENVLRSWSAMADVSVKKMSANAQGIVWGEKLLNDLTADSKLRELLGENLVGIINWYLAVSTPFGYRHKIAHGFITAEQCTHTLSAMVIWLLLKVVQKPLPTAEIS